MEVSRIVGRFGPSSGARSIGLERPLLDWKIFEPAIERSPARVASVEEVVLLAVPQTGGDQGWNS